jgi:hypothetical protein
MERLVCAEERVAMKRLTPLVLVGLLALPMNVAEGALIQGDFLVPGDGFLITDTATQLEWLTPFYTRSHSFDDAFVQNVRLSYDFRYATGSEVTQMINSNFGNPPIGSPGTPAGFAAAQSFFNLFGINLDLTCSGGSVPCPRTQGLTSDAGSLAGFHMAFGMIQFGLNGWFIVNNNFPDSNSDIQMGSWLVREAAAVPEPGTAILLAALALIAITRRRRAAHQGGSKR